MAVAGLHNISVLDSSPISRRWENRHRGSHPSPRTDIEYVSNYLSEGDLEGRTRPQNDQEDSMSYSSEVSNEFGENERERVRQIFREWNNSGVRGRETNGSGSGSRSQLLGENEREKVRIVSEWVELTTQQRSSSNGGGEVQQEGEVGSQIAQVRDGLVVNQFEVGCRKTIRKLCGRQALIDLFARAERERKKKLQCLLENRPVSDFSHRNRIQSLLRGRFLRN